MIEQIKPKHNFTIIDFLKRNRSTDFYFTKDNKRVFIINTQTCRQLLRNTVASYFTKNGNGDVGGIIVVWKSKSNNVSRNYLKIHSKYPEVAKKLLKIVLWNHNTDLYVKFNKNNKLLPILMAYGFKFLGDRGKEILILRPKQIRNTPTINK